MLPDGRELLIWRALNGDHQGMTTFEVRGTALAVITAMYDTGEGDLYESLFERLLNSFSVRDEARTP
jgi:hypothetical protein